MPVFEFLNFGNLQPQKTTRYTVLFNNLLTTCACPLLLFLTQVESRAQGLRPRPRKQKKNRGQGQPFQGQTLSRPEQECSMPRPRTKDIGTAVLKKICFLGDLQQEKF